MADTKISGLTALTSVDTDDVLPIVDTSATETKKITRANFLTGWTGSTDITTLGTIATGTWSGTTIVPAKGGTGVANGTNNTITFTGNYTLGLTLSGNTALTLPTSGTVATTSNKLSAFAATTSTELAGVISDETGSGSLVFATSPSFTTPVLGVASATRMGIGTSADATNILQMDQTSATNNGKCFYGTHSGNVTGTAYAGFLSASGTSTTNVALYLYATGATTNYALQIDGGRVFINNILSGATQAAAGANAGELWKTNGHATLPNNVIMIGV